MTEALGLRDAYKRWLRNFLIALAFLTLDPLGCASVADRYSENIFLSLAAFWSPFDGLDTPPQQASEGQNKVTVVLVRPSTVERLRTMTGGKVQGWPIARDEQYRRLLLPILSYAPRAVFVDYTLAPQTDPDAEDIQKLRDPLIDFLVAEGSGTRLYFADNPLPASTFAEGCGLPRMGRAELTAKRVTNAELAKGDWPHDGVEMVDTRFADVAGRYPLLSAELRDAAGGQCQAREIKYDGSYIASPAMAMFWQYCHDPLTRRSPSCTRRPLPAREPAGVAGYFVYQAPRYFGLPLVPFWREYSTPLARALYFDPLPAVSKATALTACRDRERQGPLRGTLGRLKNLLLGSPNGEVMFWNDDRCWAIDYLSAEDLGWTGKGIAEDKLDRLLRDRYVLLGLDLPEQRDLVASPVNGNAPGVFIHAVALENLVSWGPDYFTEDPNAFGLDTRRWWPPAAALVSQMKVTEVLTLVLAGLQAPGAGTSLLAVGGAAAASYWRAVRASWDRRRPRRRSGFCYARRFPRRMRRFAIRCARACIALTVRLTNAARRLSNAAQQLTPHRLWAQAHYIGRLLREVAYALMLPLSVCLILINASLAPLNWIGLATSRLAELGNALGGQESTDVIVDPAAQAALVRIITPSILLGVFLYAIFSALRG